MPLRIGTGLINRTWLANRKDGTKFVLQRVNPMFGGDTQLDIDAVTRHLESEGLTTTRLVPTADGALFTRAHEQIWRLLTYVDGETRLRAQSPDETREAGSLLARFHRALADFEGELRSTRGNVHDLDRHVGALDRALERHAAHPARRDVGALADEIATLVRRVPMLDKTVERVVHGDPKISNILFARDSGRALCLVDLDTLCRMPIAFELGDAFRSWCNTRDEDDPGASFSFALFEGAVTGYASAAAGFLEPAEQRDIPAGIAAITVELAARFCADALNESYFGWDPARFGSSSRHNQARTRAQLAIATQVLDAQDELSGIVQAAFGAVTQA